MKSALPSVMMKAAVIHRYGDVEELRTERIPRPEPGPGEVLVRLEAAGVNPFDTYVRSGGIARPAVFPHVLGVEGAGRVERDAGSLRAGDRVAVGGKDLGVSRHGTYAQWVVAPLEYVHPLPDEIPARQAACLFVAAGAAYFALKRSDAARCGMVVILGGSGALGSAAIQMAKAMGLRVLATVRDPSKAEAVAALGADRVIDTSRERLSDALLSETGGEGVRAVVDPLGGPMVAELVRAAAFGCRIAAVGASAGPSASYDAQRFYHKGITIEAVGVRRQPAAEIAQMYKEMFRWMASGRLRIDIDKEFHLDQAALAHRYLKEGRRLGKVVLTM